MLDQSGSVGETNHAIAIQFIQNVVSFFNIGLNRTRVSLVAFSSYAHVEFFLHDYTTLPQLQEAISEVNYRGGRTSTAIALNFTRIILNSSQPYGARPNNEGIPKIGILLTGKILCCSYNIIMVKFGNYKSTRRAVNVILGHYVFFPSHIFIFVLK